MFLYFNIGMFIIYIINSLYLMLIIYLYIIMYNVLNLYFTIKKKKKKIQCFTLFRLKNSTIVGILLNLLGLISIIIFIFGIYKVKD